MYIIIVIFRKRNHNLCKNIQYFMQVWEYDIIFFNLNRYKFYFGHDDFNLR